MKTELKKLKQWLDENQIEYTTNSIIEKDDQILITKKRKTISFIDHEYAYGGKQGLIEMWDFKKEPIGYLKADQCKKYII